MKLKTMTITEVLAAAIKELERQCKAMEGMNFPKYMIERNEKQIEELKEFGETSEFSFNIEQTIENIRGLLSDEYFIRCDTVGEAKKLAICLHKMGIKWCDGDEITTDNIIQRDFSEGKSYYRIENDELDYKFEDVFNSDDKYNPVTVIYFSELLEV